MEEFHDIGLLWVCRVMVFGSMGSLVDQIAYLVCFYYFSCGESH